MREVSKQRKDVLQEGGAESPWNVDFLNGVLGYENSVEHPPLVEQAVLLGDSLGRRVYRGRQVRSAQVADGGNEAVELHDELQVLRAVRRCQVGDKVRFGIGPTVCGFSRGSHYLI